jgi:long-chain acyl-CoA synthetase
VLKPNEREKVTEEEIFNWSKKYMAAYKYPREIEFREELPSTSSGKVLRRLLKTPENEGVKK